MKNRHYLLALSFITFFSFNPLLHAEEQPAMIDIKRMSLDMALTAAKATIDACRKEGVQVAVTIVDRGGHPQAVLRDVLAMDLTLTISRDKAYTAMSFNSATSSLTAVSKIGLRVPTAYPKPRACCWPVVGCRLARVAPSMAQSVSLAHPRVRPTKNAPRLELMPLSMIWKCPCDKFLANDFNGKPPLHNREFKCKDALSFPIFGYNSTAFIEFQF